MTGSKKVRLAHMPGTEPIYLNDESTASKQMQIMMTRRMHVWKREHSSQRRFLNTGAFFCESLSLRIFICLVCRHNRYDWGIPERSWAGITFRRHQQLLAKKVC